MERGGIDKVLLPCYPLGLWRRPQQAASAILGSDSSEQTQWPLWSGQGSPQGRILQGSSSRTLQEESLG